MPTRSRTDYQSKTFTGSRYQVGTSNPSGSNTPYTQTEEVDRRYSFDAITPGFERRRNRGEIINNDATIIRGIITAPRYPLSASDRIYQISPPALGAWGDTSDDNGRTLLNWKSSDFLSSHVGLISYEMERASKFPAPSALQQTLDSLLAQCYTQAGQSDALFLVSIIEAKKTLHSASRLVSLLPRFNTWLSSFRGRSLPTLISRLSGDAARQWLEYRYGFSQLYYDFMSYKKVLESLSRTSRVRFTKRETLVSSSSSSIPDVTSTFYVERYGWTRIRKDECVAGILVQADADWIRGFQSLGISSPFSTIWEVIPWSFIIDWFVNVGDTLAAAEGWLNRNVIASWVRRSTRMHGYHSMQTIGRDYTDGNLRYVGSYQRNASAAEVITEYVRFADPRLKLLPRFRVNLNWKKFADMAALLRQSFGLLR